jgi:stress response protein YsnF
LFNGAPVFPPKSYEDLQVKAITGPKERRLVMINNQTLALGETARIKLKDREVQVTCKEIRDKSVIIQVEGEKEPKEILLP